MRADTAVVTDVIGTDVRDTPPRRSWRLPRWATWSAVVSIALVVIVVPAARAKLADRAADWLQRQWVQRSSYDDARAAVIAQVNERAGSLDEHVVVAAAAVADREEAAVLDRLAARLAARRTWAGDVSRARDAALAALRFEVTTLLRDADSGRPTAGYLFSPPLDKLVATARSRIASMTRHRHLTPARATSVQLSPVTSALDRLDRPTDFATGLSVVIVDRNRPQILDLDSGAVTKLPPPGEFGLQFWNDGIVLFSRHAVRLLDARGRIRAVLTHDRAVPMPDGSATVWLSGPRGVRRVDASGHPLTAWIRVPVPWTPASGAGRFVVLAHFTGELPAPEQLWDPVTGVFLSLPVARRASPFVCFDDWASAGGRLVALPCDGDRWVTTLDLTTGRIRKLRLPAPVSGHADGTTNPLSPSGDLLSVVLDGSRGLRTKLLDLRTGRLTSPPRDLGLDAIGWSPDGQWVLLAENASFFPGRRVQAALWRLRDGRMTSMRIAVGRTLLNGTGLLTTTP